MQKCVLSILVVLLYSCSSVSQITDFGNPSESIFEPTTTLPTERPAYETTKQLTPTSIATLPYLATTLSPDWEGVPIMPGAFKGWSGGEWYVFYIIDSIEAVTTFYIKEVEAEGWSLVRHERDAPTYFGNSTVLEFEQEDSSEVIQIMITFAPEENSTLVSLAKYRRGP